jgi:hypothetical protein
MKSVVTNKRNIPTKAIARGGHINRGPKYRTEKILNQSQVDRNQNLVTNLVINS